MTILYQNIEVIGDNICERYIEDGVEKMRKVPFEPTFYHHTNMESDLVDIYGKHVVSKHFNSIGESKSWIKRMKDMKQEVLGMDDYALQYIHENYTGPISYNLQDIRIAFIDIEVFSQDGFPYPKICKWEIDAITHYDSKDKTYYVFSTREWWREKSQLDKEVVDNVEYKMFSTEKEMMIAYIAFWREKTPSIVTGWNSEFFDIPYIVNRLVVLFGESAPAKLSPWGKIEEVIVKEKNKEGKVIKEHQTYKIYGVTALDYIALYKKFTFKTRPNHKLSYIAIVEELAVRKIEYDGSLSNLAIGGYMPQTLTPYDKKMSNLDKLSRLKKMVSDKKKERGI